jgi:hypothetical protein
MQRFNRICLKSVRWSGWALIPVVLLFLFSGYAMSGRYGFGRWLDESTALALHKLLHLPLMILVLAHVLPACYLAIQRWGWIGQRTET